MQPINYGHNSKMNWLTPELQVEFEKLRSASRESERKLIMVKITRMREGN